jgi:nicotinate-nucleotide pyrophosphorylase (carboxylating)
MSPHRRRRQPRIVTPLGAPIIDAELNLDFPLDELEVRAAVREALEEDYAFRDVTTAATVLSDRRARATVMARQEGVLAGIPFALEAFRMLDPSVTIRVDVDDGSRVQPGLALFYISGHARGMLSAERVALNYMMRLSGIASLTRKFVDAVAGTGVSILDTRKTTPGWRRLEKYAVRAGGGMNHRMDLFSAVLIKDNHLVAVDGDIALAVRRTRELAPPGTRVEVECDSLEQVEDSVAAGADIILLDNMPVPLLKECVKLVSGRAILEASGGINLTTVRAVAETGVNWISVGALTHSAPALDLGLDFTSV